VYEGVKQISSLKPYIISKNLLHKENKGKPQKRAKNSLNLKEIQKKDNLYNYEHTKNQCLTSLKSSTKQAEK